jgi:hypothetical protein
MCELSAVFLQEVPDPPTGLLQGLPKVRPAVHEHLLSLFDLVEPFERRNLKSLHPAASAATQIVMMKRSRPQR